MTTVSTTWVGTTAVLTLDNPPVNMGNIHLRRDLSQALAAIRDNASVTGLTGVVIDSAGKHFYAGSDISEFDRPLEEPQLPSVITAIEALSVPVVAAVRGLALGGGFELALACDGRVADSSATFGFPEVTLGMIPGAGGTVRTARLLGVAAAIDLAASARQVRAEEALRLGIVDRVVEPAQLRDAAIAFAADLGGKRVLSALAAPEGSETEIDAAMSAIPHRARPNVFRAARMVKRSAEIDGAAALVEERTIFNELRVSEEAANLRYLFFAKRAAAKGLRTGASPAQIGRIGIAGAGTMGASLAKACVAAGYAVTVFDVNADALTRVAAIAPTISTVDSLEGLVGCGLIIDAVFEDLQVKRDLFQALEEIVSADTVLATNTSYLNLDDIAAEMRTAQRFGGLHFFNPASTNPLVEVIRAGTTDDATVATLSAVAARLGKTAIPAGLGDGFVANRVYTDYRTQAEFLVEDGALPHEVDAAMTELGLPIGPFAVADMSGLDIAWARRKHLAPLRNPLARYVTIADTLCEAGRLGKKTGSGWYAYPEGARRGNPDEETRRIIDEVRRAKGIQPRAIPAQEIRSRILASMLCAAATVVATGIAQRASDIDVALTEGFAFPRWLGGPLRHVSSLPESELLESLKLVYESCPITFALLAPAVGGVVPVEVAEVLRQVQRQPIAA
ncbi:3-hydroxyacyl-CoA dehydrogenase NAD-binding domain-containing protein [Cryobacterium sp. TMS1-20-1]|uniref:3-hydroxyacyl-CoA dehydrogenase NAD-binding domain-containing protein n=1 Tax=Cryobacterium sp. TMS1-20-1 TaxID=1259223 RepID=UPI00141A7278|nr:3-hydroxyacyl-CoA dehydrogenase NAD-binding domain-containing protein [Cryobacterium sp. TMS1-20-1]